MTRRATSWELTSEALESLLDLLGEDRDQAALEYERIRQRLTQLFIWRGCREPEILVDETMNRVARKVSEGLEIRSEDPYTYFCGVAHLVFKEILRRDRRERQALEEVKHLPVAEPPTPDAEERMACLERCLQTLDETDRDLILNFYQGEKSVRIKRRKALAAQLEITVNTLRVRAHRLRARLESCIRECLEGLQGSSDA